MAYPKTILAIDDDPDFLEMLKTSLEIFGNFQMTTANSGREGFRIATSQSFDVIISDLIMPDWDGEIVIEKLRQTQLNENTLIVLITATPDIASALQLENVEIIPKPFDPNDLVDRIWMAWDKHTHPEH